jgi:hypothetical protein
MAINWKKVLAGGLIAGVILIILNSLAQFVLMSRFQQEMNSWIPGATEHMATGAGVVAVGLILKFVLGTLLVWLYAAIRPRFGAGPRTAFIAAVFAWMLGAIFFSDIPMMGMVSVGTYAILDVLQFLAFFIAVWVGARAYSE